MSLRHAVSLLFGLSSAAAAQGLAPEVLQLSRIEAHMQRQLADLPNYTCLETITRFHREARQTRLRPLDIVRLELVYSGHHEWYGSPGDRQLSESNPVSFVGAGLIASGVFGMVLNNLFVAGVAMFTAEGEDSIDGRAAVKYGFRLPRMSGGLEISIAGGSGAVGEEGEFWADPQSLDLMRLHVRAAEIPPWLPLTRAEYDVTYARSRLGGLDTLLAQHADVHMLEAAGTEGFDRFDFTHCRVFQASSNIHFEGAPDAAGAAGPSEPPGHAAAPAMPAVPALLPITVLLATRVTDRDTVGQLIEGHVAGAVRHKGKVIVEDGAAVRGRIRRLDRYEDGAHFVVGLEFTEVETPGGPMRFYADLLRLEKRKGVRPVLHESVRVPDSGTSTAEVTLPELPGVATFFVDGKTFELPAGFRTEWRTRGILRGAD